MEAFTADGLSALMTTTITQLFYAICTCAGVGAVWALLTLRGGSK